MFYYSAEKVLYFTSFCWFQIHSKFRPTFSTVIARIRHWITVNMYHVYVFFPQRIACVVRKVEYPHDDFKCLLLIANRRRQMGRSARMTFIPTATSIKHVTFIRTHMNRKFHKQQPPSQFHAYSTLFRLSVI